MEKILSVLISENQDKIKEVLFEMLNKAGNFNINIVKQENFIKIMQYEDIRGMVSLHDKIIELEESLYPEKKGELYKVALAIIEKPLIERALLRAEGNQLKASRMLGLNRNTMRSKIRKLGINAEMYKL